MTIKEAYLLGREHLAAGSTEAPVEAEMLLRCVLGVDRAQLYTHWDETMEEAPWQRYQEMLEERARGRPLHYIIGEREFMGLAFFVDERVMIPRPETEALVEFAAAWLEGRSRPVVVDVGTGSGCIAVSLAHLLPEASVYATDLSSGALEVAARNALRHGVSDRVVFLQGDLLDALPAGLGTAGLGTKVDAVLSNPPYVPEADATAVPWDVRGFEPWGAIFAPGDGMDHHRALAAAAGHQVLRPGGLLAMEVGAGQAASVAQLLRESGRYSPVGVRRDGAGVERVVWGTVEN